MAQNTIKYYFNYSNDYKKCLKVRISDEYNEDDTKIEFEVPKKYRLYLVEYFYGKILYEEDIGDIEGIGEFKNAENMLLKIFSIVHNSLPFDMSDFTCPHQYEHHIFNMPINTQLENIINTCIIRDNKWCIAIIMDNEGNIYIKLVITPI